MLLKVVENQEYVDAVKLNLDKSPEEVKYVIEEKLKGFDCFFWGGAVREPIYHVMYDGTDWMTTDWDIIVDDYTQSEELDLDRLFSEERKDKEKCEHNRYDTIKWKPRTGVEIDISRFSNANMIRREETKERSLIVALASCDYNTGSIAYGLRDGQVYDGGAIEWLKMRTIDLHYADDYPHVIMARLVMHSNDMGFAIGSAGLSFIKHKYTDKTSEVLDGRIAKYLRRKGKYNRFDEVNDRLKEIAFNSD